ncbi:D-glycero-beta-D-manno-heptose 1-phosphate adenylyltransferase [Skermanella mucosa]|uniref:D-glycero-beta-D-manno-heptose 1-phosphate adenylyltransferase n=1 Tax=Skermanella mucosa TaxID=1789672 RepID=UPI00192B4399|nr:D-glycero-beta-D-manno-heptose 1-phosphate adenylyltransferase [Skermanella mucosa]UEM18685.1 D-glycero-beta-D-manno-heptose 1-phosphate adenylyltransferase [Skermanella mucosa]
MSVAHFSGNFPNVRVICLGDVMIDHFYYGEVSRISPEAPVPVLKLSSKQTMLGGAANTAANIRSLGARVDIVAPLGDDDAGREFRLLIEHNPGITLTAMRDPRGTIVKSRYSANGQQLLRIDYEDLNVLPDETHDALAAAVEARLEGAALLVLSDYAKGALSQKLCRKLIAAAYARGVPVVADPKGRDFSRYAGAAVITPNEQELARAVGRDLTDEIDLVREAARLAREYDLGHVAVTRGKDGVTLVDRDGVAETIPSFALDVFDVSGAGDSFVAGLVCALAVGQDMIVAAHYANAVAGIAVGKVGTAVVRAEEALRLIARHATDRPEAITADLAELRRQVDVWRREGLRIGFTNGCFDLLHLGHLRTLRAARETCDRLIVGLNSDASVRRLKGSDRPIQSEMVRAEVLAAMEMVDLVAIFEKDDPLELIEACVPDTLVKGGDYQAEAVVGHDVVVACGGDVVIVPTLAGFSTTSIISRMRKFDA